MKYTMKDLGCYFDGAYGFVCNAERIIDFATDHHGFTYEGPLSVNEIEHLVDLTDDAMNHLNDNTERPPNTYWNWEDGDFGLWLYCEQCGEVTDEDYQCCKEE